MPAWTDRSPTEAPSSHCEEDDSLPTGRRDARTQASSLTAGSTGTSPPHAASSRDATRNSVDQARGQRTRLPPLRWPQRTLGGSSHVSERSLGSRSLEAPTPVAANPFMPSASHNESREDTHPLASTRLPSTAAPSLNSSPTRRPVWRGSGEEGVRVVPANASLPQTHLTAHVPFLLCCYEWTIDQSARDWNEEFQTLWADMLEIQIRSGGYTERMRTFLREYEAFSQELVERLFEEGNGRGTVGNGLMGTAAETNASAPASADPLAALGCVRCGNLVLRVWRDPKLALNMQRCFRAFVETRSPWLFAPLTATFRHLNVCVSVQALIPLRSVSSSGGVGSSVGVSERSVLYRGDGMDDSAPHRPTVQTLDFVLGALNLLRHGGQSSAVPRGDSGAPPAGSSGAAPASTPSQERRVTRGAGAVGTDSTNGPSAQPSSAGRGHTTVSDGVGVLPAARDKLVGVEVVGGVDERLYVVNPLGLLPPMVAAQHHATPLRRWLHVVRHPPQCAAEPADVAALYKADIDGAIPLLTPALGEVEHRRGERLVELLHANGLNVCLLGHIAESLYMTPREDVSASHEPLLRLLATEMLARAVRRLMFRQMALDNSPVTIRAASAYLTRTVASLIDPSPERFVDGLMPVITEMFLLGTNMRRHAAKPAGALPTAKSDGGSGSNYAMDGRVNDDHGKSPLMPKTPEASLSLSVSSANPNGPMLLAAPLATVLRDATTAIVQRVCQLSGLQMLRGDVGAIGSPPSKHNFSALLSAQHEELLASFYLADQVAEQPPAEATQGGLFTTCFVRLRRAEYLGRTGQLRACLAEMRRVVREAGLALQYHPFVNAHLWATTAVVAAACSERTDAVVLADKAVEVVEVVPTYDDAEACRGWRPPLYPKFLRGQVKMHIARGYVFCLMHDFPTADACFEKSLRCSDILDASGTTCAAHLRLESFVGLFEVASGDGSVERAVAVDRRWGMERISLPATPLGAHISEMLGSLLLEREAFAMAAARLWECLKTTEALRGSRAYVVAEVLNKVAFAYYSWDADRCGVYSSCMLRLAEDITVEACGIFSSQHLCVIENIVVLAIRRKRFVEASQLIHMVKTLPPRYALRVPRDHPVAIRLPEIEAKLREEFKELAALMIQRCWREYTSKMLVRAVCEASAEEIQRVSRGFMVRRELQRLRIRALKRKLSEPARLQALEELRMKQHIPVMLSFSKPLISAAVLFSKDCRNFNGEYQRTRIFHMWWDAVEGAEQRKRLLELEEEFVEAASACAIAAQRDPTLAQPVLACSTSFVVDNIVFTRIARGSELAYLQNTLFKTMRQVPQQVATATLSAIIEDPASPDTELYAEALIPLDRQPQFALLSDGRAGVQGNAATRVVVDVVTLQFREAGLTPHPGGKDGDAAEDGPKVTGGAEDTERGGGAGAVQGLEIVRGLDDQYYFTNMLGLVYNVIQTHTTDWSPPESRMGAIARNCLEGKSKEMLELLEKALISADSHHPILKHYTCLTLACVRFAAGRDSPTTHKYFQMASTELEEAGLYRDAILANYDEARTSLREDASKAAIGPLLRAFHIIREKIRLRPYFGSCYIVETARWLLAACQASDRPFDEGALKITVAAMENGEPSQALFTTCERFISHARKTGDKAALEMLLDLRERRARGLSPGESERFALCLKKESEEAFRRGGSESYRACAVLLVTAIHLAEAKHEDTLLLASLLNLYGWLQTTLNNLKQAQKSLGKAYRILVKTSSTGTQEMFTWGKNNRMLKNRLRENAIRIIRRAVRRWKERKRLIKELQHTNPEEYAQVMRVQLVRRMNRLSVSEATQRVLITEAEAEEYYQLGRQQRRGRNEAMLRQTYSARVQLYLDKLQSAMSAVVELAVSTKAALEGLYWQTHIPLQANALLTGHRLGRREIITEWRADTVGMKLWHVEHVDEVIREEFMTAYQHYLRRCVSAEERAWRRVIVKLQKKTKKKLGRIINRTLRSKPKNVAADLRALIVQEEIARGRICGDEADDFTRIDDDWAYGPEVAAEVEDQFRDDL